MLLRILLVSALLFISACQHSPRKEYFALSSAKVTAANESTAIPSNQIQSSGSTEKPAKVIGIGPFTIPEYLQHTRISYWKTSNQLILQENHYWAEPLEQGISRVLGLELQAAHPQWRLVRFPWRSSQRPAYTIRVDIQRLDAFSDHAIIVASLDLIDTKTNRIIRSKLFSSRVASASHSAAIAQAFSELLQQTAADMEALLNELLFVTGK